MKNPYILFRRAEIEEIDIIWDVLHSQSVPWNDSQIKDNISRIFVLLVSQKILGVLYCSDLNKGSADWIAIHPMYPEEMLRKLMLEQLQSFCMVDGSKPGSMVKLTAKTALNGL